MGMASGCKIKKKRSVNSITKIIAGYFKNQPVVKAWLFGSFARGEQTPESDVDILVVLDENENVGFKFFGMYEDLRELLGRNVDLVTDGSLAPFARQSVEKDKKLVYERTSDSSSKNTMENDKGYAQLHCTRIFSN